MSMTERESGQPDTAPVQAGEASTLPATLSASTLFPHLPTLQTSRLLLRPILLSDLADYYEYVRDPDLTRHLTWDAPRDMEAAGRYIEDVVGRYHRGQLAPWGVADRDDGALIGTCGYRSWDEGHHHAEIAYALAPRHWGKGYMPEAIRAVLAFGFGPMGLNRVDANCMTANQASESVMKKVGMTFEGILRQYVYVRGAYHDLKLYSILRSEFRE
jgi:ribosomal-protein-alanine N-acetyltransferase